MTLDETKRNYIHLFRAIVTLAIVAVISYFFIQRSVQRQNLRMQESFLQDAFRVLPGININQHNIKVLSITTPMSPRKQALLQRISSQLQGIVKLRESWRACYLIGRDGDLGYFVQVSSRFGSDQEKSKELNLRDRMPCLFQAFTESISQTQWVNDNYGSWVTAFAPISDPQTGEVVSVLCLDIDAAEWHQKATRAGFAPMVFSCILLCLLLATLLYAYHAPKRTGVIYQYAAVSLTVIFGSTLSALLFWLFGMLGTAHLRDSFAEIAARKLGHVGNSLTTLRQAKISLLQSMLEKHAPVTREVFETQIGLFDEFPLIRHWAWLPLVPTEEREVMETAFREDGLPDFRIWHGDDNGTPCTPPTNQTFFLPLTYTYSTADKLPFPMFRAGVDFASIPKFEPVLEEAALLQLPTTSQIFFRDRENQKDPYMDIFIPIYADPGTRQQLLGYLLAVFEPQQLLEDLVISQQYDDNRLARITVYEETDPDVADHILAKTCVGVPMWEKSVFDDPETWELVTSMGIWGCLLKISAEPTMLFFTVYGSKLHWIMLAFGLCLTMVFAFIAYALSKRREVLETWVRRRTLSLDEMVKRHDLLDRQTKSFMWQTNPEFLFTDLSPSIEDVLGFLPEDLLHKVHAYDMDPHAKDADRKTEDNFLYNMGTNTTHWETAHPSITKDGGTAWLSTHVVTIRDKKGKVSGYQGVSTDITERHLAERERNRLLAENNNMTERYRAILEAANIGDWQMEATGRHLRVGDGFFRLLGYTPEEFKEQNGTPEMDQLFMQMIHPEDQMAVAGGMAAYLENPRAFYQDTIRMRHASGKWMWIFIRGRNIQLPNAENVLTGIILDVSHMKNTESALRENEAKYRMLTENTQDVFWIMNAANMHFSYMSPAVQRLLGFSAAEMNRKTFPELFKTEEAEMFTREIQQRLSAVQSGKAMPNDWFSYTASPIRRDGGLMYAEIVMRYRHNPQTGQIDIHGVMRDITRRWQAEQALKERELQYRLISESMYDMVWITDAETLDYIYVSPSSARLLGYTPEELMTQKLSDLFPPEKSKMLHAQVRGFTRRVKEGTLPPDHYSFNELDVRRKDGTIAHTENITRYYINPITKRVEFHGEMRDIAIRKKAEQALRESEQKYRNLAENVKDLVWILDAETLTFTYLSSSIENLYPQITTEKQDQVHVSQLYAPDDLDALKEEVIARSRDFRAGRITTDDFFTYTPDFLLPDGTQVPMESIVHYQLNPQTNHIELSGVSRDVSSRKLAEKYHDMGVRTLQMLNEPKGMDELLQELVQMFKDVSGIDAAGIRMRNGHDYPYAASTGFPPNFIASDTTLLLRNADNRPSRDEDGNIRYRCACGRVAAGDRTGVENMVSQGGTLWSNDAIRDFTAIYSEADQACAKARYGSMAITPIRFHDLTMGLLQFCAVKKNAFTPDTIFLLEAIASHIAEAFMRKRAEQDYRALFHEMLEGFAVQEVVLDDLGEPEDFRFISINPAFERYAGSTAEKLLGQPVSTALPWLMRSTRTAYEQIRHADKALYCQRLEEHGFRYEELSVFRLSDTQFATIFNDVTQRTVAETALHESQRQYAALLSNLPGMAYRYRYNPDGSWNMEFVSDGTRALLGYEPEEILHKTDLFDNWTIVKSFRKATGDAIRNMIAHGGKLTHEHQLIAKDGSIKWAWEQAECIYDESGQLLGIEGFVTDVTDRKTIEAERERLAQAFEQSRETVVITDSTGTIIYANKALTEMTGWDRKEAIGQKMTVFSKDKMDPERQTEILRTLQIGKTWEGRYENTRKDGTTYPEQISLSPVFNEDGTTGYYIALRHDATQEMQLAEEREQLQTQMLQANKMESIGRLAGGIAHDFNNMLQAIMGYAEMAIEQVQPDQPIYQDIQSIQTAARHSADLTRQLLIFARRQAVKPKTVKVNDAIEAMTGILRRLIGVDIDFNWEPGKDNTKIQVDPNQLDQILANLCINARDAIDGPGTITVRTSRIQIDAPMMINSGTIEPGTYAMLAVKDSGSGMTPEVMTQIFEPFFTTKKAGKGTGLGLATVYGIVKQCKGGIILHSELGKGTTFEILLPAAAETEEGLEEELAAEGALTRGKGTILLVDDEETILRTTQRMLESVGYTVIALTDSTKALQLVKDGTTHIDIVISDVIMPTPNGPEMIEAMLEINPDLPFFFISGYTANLHLNKKYNRTPEMLSKPFTRQQLAAKVKSYLEPTPQ